MEGSLELQYDLAIRDDIRQTAGPDLDFVAPDRQADMLAKQDSRLGELVAKAPWINGSERPRVETSMTAHREANDAPGEILHSGQIRRS